MRNDIRNTFILSCIVRILNKLKLLIIFAMDFAQIFNQTAANKQR